MIEIRDGIGISFEDLESVVWKSVLASHQEALKAVLETLDQALALARDTKRYILKERRPRELVTQAGVLRFERRYYWDQEEAAWVSLLDEALGIEERKRASEAVRARAVEAAVGGRSYRGAEGELERQAGQAVFSHEAIRQWTLRAGDVLERQTETQQAPPEKRRGPVTAMPR